MRTHESILTTKAYTHTFKWYFIFYYESKDISQQHSHQTDHAFVCRGSPSWTCLTWRQICLGNNCSNVTRAYIVFAHLGTNKCTHPWLLVVYTSECISGPLVSEMNYHAAALVIPVSLWNQLESTIRHSFCCHTENNHLHISEPNGPWINLD